MRAVPSTSLCACLAVLASASGGCFYDFDRDLADAAADRGAAGDLGDPAVDAPHALALCDDPDLRMHLRFNGSPADRIDNEQPVSGTAVYSQDGKPPLSLLLEAQDGALEYTGAGNVEDRGTVMLWIKPAYQPETIDNNTVYYIFSAEFGTQGYLRLVHRRFDSAGDRGVGVEAVGPHGAGEWEKIWLVLAEEKKFAANAWAHLAVTFQTPAGTPEIRLYLNGAFLKGNESTIIGKTFFSGTADKVKLGIDLTAGDAGAAFSIKRFDGCVDEVMAFSRVLEESEIAALYQLQNGGQTCP